MKHLKLATLALAAAVGLVACSDDVVNPVSPRDATTLSAASANKQTDRINVLLNRTPDETILSALAEYGRVVETLTEIDAVVLSGDLSVVAQLEALPFVASAERDVEQSVGPIDPVAAETFADGLSTWNLDAINVTNFGFNNRTVAYDGTGVYIGVLDTGLLHTWRNYFPDDRIATQYAKAFNGGPNGRVQENPNKWEHDVDGHGTHVTSTIIGYDFFGTPINGVAPKATIIPVKVLDQGGSGYSSVIAQGIIYIANLKEGELAGHPMVINMSLGGSRPSSLQKRAIDYAIARGVIIVASAGNSGTAGMGYPGAFEPVISVASAGWGDCNLGAPNFSVTGSCYGQWYPWTNISWWYSNVSESGTPDQFYISSFSSREKAGQDLDVVAPGHWVLGPYQVNRGASEQTYYYLSGTSMASPHVAGIVALMAQKQPSLTASQAEEILERAALPMAPGTHFPLAPGATSVFRYTWGADATGEGFITADAALAGTS